MKSHVGSTSQGKKSRIRERRREFQDDAQDIEEQGWTDGIKRQNLDKKCNINCIEEHTERLLACVHISV